ncbi:MAG: GNAT family N-acetyltransferase [Candidatus Velamenicoccus archaeovorus]
MAGTAAWELAHEAAGAAGVRLRPLDALEDADEILRVMIATWGEHQLVPREMLVALAHSGNVPYGAVREDEIVGYVLGWAGVDGDGLHVHSHMLAVLPDRRHGGVGYALKLAQRAQALDQGIHVVRWTFDPMVARNAWFNLGKLGAVADRFSRDFYGQMGDLLNRGERSDRFVARWDLDREPGPRAVEAIAVVEVPEDHAGLRERDPAAARLRRDEVADAVERQLELGRVAAAFDRERSAYLFVPAETLGADRGVVR